MVENALNPQVRAILLDFDDTLIDMKKASYLSFNEALRSHGLRTVNFDEMLANWDKSWREVIERLAPANKDMASLMTGVGKEYRERFEKIHLQYSTLMPGAVQVLKKLKMMRLMTAIISRRWRRIIEEELEKFKIRRYVDTIVGREDVANLKPAPDALILAAERLGVPIEHCLVVGDSPNDIKASKAAGAKVVAVLTGPYDKERIFEQKPDIVLGSIADLLTFRIGGTD